MALTPYSSNNSASGEDLNFNDFFYPVEERPSTLTLPPEQLQTFMQYLPCAFDQYAMRCVNKEWCWEATNFIQHQNTVSVEDARAFLEEAMKQLNKPETQSSAAIAQLTHLSTGLEDILGSQKLFGPRKYVTFLSLFENILKQSFPTNQLESITTLRKEISTIPRSKISKIYNKYLNLVFLNKEDQIKTEGCVLDLAEMGAIQDATELAQYITTKWYNAKPASCPSFGVVAHQQLLQGDIYGSHKTLNKGDTLRIPSFEGFTAAVDDARKELYIQLISYKFNEIVIELSQTPKAHRKFVTPAANALIHAFIECGQLRQAFDLILDSERLWDIDPESMKQKYANKIIAACVAPEDPSEEDLNLALEAAEASGSPLFMEWASTEVEKKRRNKK